MERSVHTHTPVLQVNDPRGLTVRTVNYCRSATQPLAQARIELHRYDAAERTIAQWDPRLAMDASAPANLVTVRALSGAQLSTQSVDAGWRVTLFAEGGQAVQAWDGRGSERVIEYDELLRPVAVFEPGCTQRYVYAGAEDHFADHNQCGQLVRHDDTAGTRHFEDYGVTGEVLTLRQHFLQALDEPDWPQPINQRDALLEPGDGATTAFRFNALGDLTAQVDARGHRQYFNQTLDGRLREAGLLLNGKVEPRLLVRDIRYDARGQVEQQTAGNQVVSLFDYRPEDGRLTRLRARHPNGACLQDLNYGYDPVGNILNIEDKALPVRFFANQCIEPIKRYTYDSLYQLIEATGWEAGSENRGPAQLEDPNAVANYRQTYRYDEGGNLLELTHQGPQQHGRVLKAAKYSNRCLPLQDGRPPTEAEIAAAFDHNGNLLALDNARTLQWDVRNRLQQVTPVERDLHADDIERYVYAADGMRQRKVRMLQTNARALISETRYLPGLETRNIENARMNVITVQAERMTVQVLHWETPVPRQLANDQYRYNLSDYLGSCSLELDSEAKVVSRETYHPYGSTAFTERGDSSEDSYRTLRYSGKTHDASGLYDYGLRYYAPWLNRWVNPDPAGHIDGLNFFRFVRNNPCTLIDREGLAPQVPQKVEPQEFMDISEGLVARMEGIAKAESKSKKTAEADLKKINNSGKKNLQKEAVRNEKERLEKVINEASIKEKKANQAATMFGEYGRAGDKYVLKNEAARPVGVMSLTDDDQSNAKKIETIATDIETSGNGAVLIEHAVNESERAGLKGVVTLVDVSAGSDSAGDTSKNIYSYFGFEPLHDEPGKMKLVPSQSALWMKNGKTWERVRKSKA